MHPDLPVWMAKAWIDLSSGWKVMGGQSPDNESAVFHAQQAVEKAIKAFLLAKEISFPRTHDLCELLRLGSGLISWPEAFLGIAEILNPYAVAIRYPNEMLEPDADETRSALCSAGELLVWVEQQLLVSGCLSDEKIQLTIVVPMVGLGKRFSDVGYTTPKPLIPVFDKPMYAWAVDSLPLHEASRIIFILLRTMPGYDDLGADIWRRYGRLRPIILDVPEPTRGRAESVLRAKLAIDRPEEILIHSADTAFEAGAAWLADARKKSADGALLVFPSDHPRWSYSLEGSDGWVKEVREKEVISPWATTGTYWFKRACDFVRLAEKSIRSDKKQGNEFCVGPLYSDLIAEGKKVKNYPIKKLHGMSTPEELDAFLKNYSK